MWASVHAGEAERPKGTIGIKPSPGRGDGVHYTSDVCESVQELDKKFNPATVRNHIRQMEAFIAGDSDWTDHDETTLALSQCDPSETGSLRVAHAQAAHARMKEEMRSFDTETRKIHKFMRYVDGERPSFNFRSGQGTKETAWDPRPWATIDRDEEYTATVSRKVHSLKIQQRFAQASSVQAKAEVAMDVAIADAASVLRMMPPGDRKDIMRCIARKDRKDDTDVCRDIRAQLNPRLDVNRDNDDQYEQR